MRPILPEILTLEQHLSQLQRDPESYRPERCPACGKGGLWCHGCYTRKADRDTGALNPVPIPRFRCPFCKVTCSVLPECLPPRRWYLWAVQQLALVALLVRQAFNPLARQWPPSRATFRRWWRQWQSDFELHAFHLRNRLPDLGRHERFTGFWGALLKRHRLGAVMRLLNHAGVTVP